MAKKKRAGKGFFGELKLPLSTGYQSLGVRRWIWTAGGMALLLVLVVGVADYFLRSGNVLSNGPVSTHHAGFEAECSACHAFDLKGQIPAQRCNECHERFGDEQGVYSYAAHYVYRSNDLARKDQPDHQGHELECAACHTEHVGRTAEITDVPDSRCATCHFASFQSGHPEFEFAAQNLGDDRALRFTHVRHTYEVMQDRKFEEIERACLFCHNTDADGKNFQSIDFDLHCNGCHLKPNEGVDLVPVQSGDTPGVETYLQIKRRGGPGTGWTSFVNPGEYTALPSLESATRIGKRPLYHQDPWVMENLRQWRRTAYGPADLGDLLLATPDLAFAGAQTVQRGQVRELYEEALDTLALYAADLRPFDSDDVQKRLQLLDVESSRLRRQLDNPAIQLDPSLFALPQESRLAAPALRQIDEVAGQLTEGCTTKCHMIERYTVARVQKDQEILRRAEFDHRSHILDAGCLDCHDKIPIGEEIKRIRESGDETFPDSTVDRAEIQNMPTIDSCRECHSAQLSGERCATCHYFHPNKGRRSDLLVYLD